MEYTLLTYYLMKRIFLFFDEWLFYFVLIYLVKKRYYKITPIVMLYGLACIYTSYTNINKIEENLVDIHQIIWLSDKPIIHYIYDGFIIIKNLII
ncbi:hypothetical protein Indivirus_8_11 [Indivirus ILV1]|uniref:Uncharacterized protein n=1 Tax=Indivirus ILV1 TaxID=1977633 RepID=A0A1V0SEA3_9VIRU|nr:hypothetical protein Indivirus_8_11 [Indivirus ILV1]